MSAISDLAAQQAAFNSTISSDLDSIKNSVTDLNTTIQTLQNSTGSVTASDQALIDTMESQGKNLQAKADLLAGKAPVLSAPVLGNNL